MHLIPWMEVGIDAKVWPVATNAKQGQYGFSIYAVRLSSTGAYFRWPILALTFINCTALESIRPLE